MISRSLLLLLVLGAASCASHGRGPELRDGRCPVERTSAVCAEAGPSEFRCDGRRPGPDHDGTPRVRAPRELRDGAPGARPRAGFRGEPGPRGGFDRRGPRPFEPRGGFDGPFRRGPRPLAERDEAPIGRGLERFGSRPEGGAPQLERRPRAERREPGPRGPRAQRGPGDSGPRAPSAPGTPDSRARRDRRELRGPREQRLPDDGRGPREQRMPDEARGPRAHRMPDDARGPRAHRLPDDVRGPRRARLDSDARPREDVEVPRRFRSGPYVREERATRDVRRDVGARLGRAPRDESQPRDESAPAPDAARPNLLLPRLRARLERTLRQPAPRPAPQSTDPNALEPRRTDDGDAR